MISLHAVCETSKHLYLVTENIGGSESHLFHRISEMGHFGENDAASVIHQLLKALDYLHSLNIVHRGISEIEISFIASHVMSLVTL